MVHNTQNLEDFEFNSRFRNSTTLRSLKHVINIIIWIRDTGCYTTSAQTSTQSDRWDKAMGQIRAPAPKPVHIERLTSNAALPQKQHIRAQLAGHK
jgi:hypothetical protein